MPIIKIKDLKGAALDWAVAQLEDNKHVVFSRGAIRFPPAQFSDEEVYSPSTDWAQGGPIIEREIAEGLHLHGRSPVVAVYYNETLGGFECESYGPTPLVAAMRCYVASVLGDETYIPEDLL